MPSTQNFFWIIGFSLAFLSSITSPAYGEWNLELVYGLWDGVTSIPDKFDFVAAGLEKWRDARFGGEERSLPDPIEPRSSNCIHQPIDNTGRISLNQQSIAIATASPTTVRIRSILGDPYCYTKDGEIWLAAYNQTTYLQMTYKTRENVTIELKNVEGGYGNNEQ